MSTNRHWFTELALLGRLLAFIGEDNETMDETE